MVLHFRHKLDINAGKISEVFVVGVSLNVRSTLCIMNINQIELRGVICSEVAATSCAHMQIAGVLQC